MKIHCAYSELVPLFKIIPNPRNTNEHPDSQIDLLSKIIDYQGVRHPIIVSNRSGFIVAGHGRLLAAKKLGLDTYPVEYQDFATEAQEYEFLESDNRLAELAEHNHQKMLENIREIPGIKIDMIGIPNLTIVDAASDYSESGIPDDQEKQDKSIDKLCPQCGFEL